MQDQSEYLQQRKSELKALTESAGWQTFKMVLEGQIRLRKNSVFGMGIRSMDAAFTQADLLGEVTGLTTALGLPYALIEDYDKQLQDIREEEENGPSESTDGPDSV